MLTWLICCMVLYGIKIEHSSARYSTYMYFETAYKLNTMSKPLTRASTDLAATFKEGGEAG